MTSMIERVAIALSDADEPGIWNERPEQGGGTVVLWEAKEYFRAASRAAILAMREPTDGMVSEGANGVLPGHPIPALTPIWQAMIDAALQDAPDDR